MANKTGSAIFLIFITCGWRWRNHGKKAGMTPLLVTSNKPLSKFPFPFSKSNCGAEHCVLVSNPKEGLWTLLPIASWHQHCQGKHNTAKHKWTRLHLHREERATSASAVCIGPSWVARPLGIWHRAHERSTPILCHSREWNAESWRCAWEPGTNKLTQNKGTLIAPKAGYSEYPTWYSHSRS